jgi:hypothetical protein
MSKEVVALAQLQHKMPITAKATRRSAPVQRSPAPPGPVVRQVLLSSRSPPDPARRQERHQKPDIRRIVPFRVPLEIPEIPRPDEIQQVKVHREIRRHEHRVPDENSSAPTAASRSSSSLFSFEPAPVREPSGGFPLRSIAQITTSWQATRFASSTLSPPLLPDPVVPTPPTSSPRRRSRHRSRSVPTRPARSPRLPPSGLRPGRPPTR